MRAFTIKLPKHLEELLDRLARERGISRSEVVRHALEAYGARPTLSALDLAGDLVGSLKGGPSDLATNPKYMKDFGK